MLYIILFFFKKKKDGTIVDKLIILQSGNINTMNIVEL